VTKGRVAVIGVVLAVLALAGSAVAWRLYTRSGVRLLNRAQLALDSGLHDKALTYCEQFIEAYPDDWHGHYIKGKALIAKGLFDDARAALETAGALDEATVDVTLAVADTYSLEARQAISGPDSQNSLPTLERAVINLRRAQDTLVPLQRDSTKLDPKTALNIRRHVGMISLRVAWVQGMLAQLLDRQGDQADLVRDTHTAQAKRRQAERIRRQADASCDEATAALLEVVRADPTQDEVAQELIQLCLSRSDAKSLAEVRKAVLGGPNPPPVAANLLIIEDLRTQVSKTPPAEREKLLRRTSQRLEALLTEHGENPQVLSARAAVALYQNDFPTAWQYVRRTLAAQADHPLGRFLQAKLLALKGDLVTAEREFYALRTALPYWAAAQYEYALLAFALGKRELAQESMRAVTNLDPGHTEAHRFMADMLLREGLYTAAYTDAEAAYQANRYEPHTLRVYVEACVRTNQKDKAGAALDDAALIKANDSQVLLSVAEGYQLMDNRAASHQAARRAAALPARNVFEQVSVARALALLGESAHAEKYLRDALKALGDQASSTRPAQSQPSQDPLPRRGDKSLLLSELARMYALTGRLIQAAEVYRQVLRLEPGNTQHRLVLARILLDLGDLDECERILDQMHPDHPQANLLRISLKLSQGLDQEAMQIFQQTQAGERSGLPLAVMQLASGKIQQCIQTCLVEMSASPRDANLRTVLGRAYRLNGQAEQAVEQYLAAIRLEPSRLQHYLTLAGLLCQVMPPQQAAFRMASIPEARSELIDLSLGMILARARNWRLAAEHLSQLISRQGISESVRGQARMLRAQCLAASGQADQAVIELSQLVNDPHWSRRASLARIPLLAGTQNIEQAKRDLAKLQETAAKENDVWLLQRVASLAVHLGQDATAQTACDALDRIMPYDATSCILRGYAHSRFGRKDAMVASYREALARQPERLDVYMKLASLLDLHNEPQQVLDVLEELKGCGLAGKAMGLWGQASILDSWGLRSRAAERLDALAELGYGGDRIEFMLSQYYVRLGRLDAARKILQALPPRSRYHLPARQVLIEMENDPQVKLQAIERLRREQPAHSGLLLQMMNVLLQSGRGEDAVQAMEAHLARYRSAPHEALALSVAYLLDQNKLPRAVQLSEQLARLTRLPYWRVVHMLLLLEQQPLAAQRLLGESDKAPMVDALCGLAIALQSGNDSLKQGYLARLEVLDKQREIPSLYRLLVLLAGEDQDKILQESTAVAGGMGKDVVDEIVAYRGPGREGELAFLLRASMLLDMGLNRYGAEVAVKALKARSTCQWAAALVFRCNPRPAVLAEAIATLRPAGGSLHQAMRTRQLTQERKFSELAQLYEQALGTDKENIALQIQHAWATAACGQHQRALDLYRRVMDKRPVPEAANNAANLVGLFYRQDKALVAEARAWAQAAVAAAPENVAFHETAAWLDCLQGRYREAAEQLRQVIRRLPGSAAVHYHLGAAEVGVGRKELGLWHLQEAVTLASLALKSASDDEELKAVLEQAKIAMEQARSQPADPPAAAARK